MLNTVENSLAKSAVRSVLVQRSSAVSLAAIANAENLDPAVVIVKTNAVVSKAEPQFGRIDLREPFHIALLGRKKAREPV